MRCLNKIGNYCFDKIEELKQEGEALKDIKSDIAPSLMSFDTYQFKEGTITGQIEAYVDVLTMIVDEVKANLNQ